MCSQDYGHNDGWSAALVSMTGGFWFHYVWFQWTEASLSRHYRGCWEITLNICLNVISNFALIDLRTTITTEKPVIVKFRRKGG